MNKRRVGTQSIDEVRWAWRYVFLAVVPAILLTPVVAMPFSTQVSWGLEDFGAAGAIFAAAWLAIEIIFRSIIKAGAVALVASILLFTWAHLAVGVF